jgi:16S rRNA (adenine1518-N6/adenine1519-N6)-dimethyltransferase
MKDNIITQVQEICRLYDIHPAHAKGQNFLVNPEINRQIIAAAELQPGDLVLEVGPGLGILTEELVKKAKEVISIELDRKLFNFLKVKFISSNKLELINEDILSFDPTRLPAYPPTSLPAYKIVANLPYNITSVFLRKFLTAAHKPESMVLLLQKEVAERLCAKPGQMSLLAISVQLYGQPQIVGFVGQENFWPKPKVDSAIIKISNIKKQAEIDNFLGQISEKLYWQIIKIGFSAKRKQLQHNLSAGLKISPAEVKDHLSRAGFDPKIRAQNLSISDWLALAKIFKIYFK